MSAGRTLFAAISEAMQAIVSQFPSGSERPDWVSTFVHAVGPYSDFSEMCRQLDADAKAAELWRFMLQTIYEGNPEGQVMRKLGAELGNSLDDNWEENPQGADAFAAYVAQGLERFKAGAH